MRDACYTCVTTFRRDLDHERQVQPVPSPFERFEHILKTRKPNEWPQSPNVDIGVLKLWFPGFGHGDFPFLDLHKVEMDDYNKDKPLSDRRELIFYRLCKPIPREDINAHILCHVFEYDRNGLLMLANHLGYGFNLGVVGTISASFFVHVNGKEAVLEGDGWWLQEVKFPRFSAGRGMMESTHWSPDGKHVASGYQDGLVLPVAEKKREKKL